MAQNTANTPAGQREVGSTKRLVGPVGLGCMGMSWAYAASTRDDEASRAVVRAAVEAGVTFIDTADVYGDGHNEQLVGQALTGIRDEVFLATKCGLVVDDLTSLTMHRDGSPEHVRAAVEASLQRLGTDHVDLYYLHRVDEAVPLEETWGAMAALVQQGKVLNLGLSEVSVAQAEVAAAIHPVTAIQSELSLWTRDALEGRTADGTATGDDIVSWCAGHGAAFVPFSPLGRGFLTGSIDAQTSFESSDLRAANPRFTLEARRQNARIVDVVREIAGRHEATAAQVAIAWTLTQGEHVLPIPGTRRQQHLEDNIGAGRIELSAPEVQQLNELPVAVGTRY